MIIHYQQCQTQLELERVVTSHKVQQMSDATASDSNDPVNRQVLQQMQSKLHRIEAAQARFNNGQYGLCQTCKQTIDPERLEILPYTEHCAACQRATERQVLRGTNNTN